MTQSRKWMIGTAIACVVILAASWFLLAKPQRSKVASLKEQTAAQQSANSLLLTQISALQAEQKELPQQQLILQKFSTEVPESPAEPTLIRQLSSAANGSGVDLSTITPGTIATLTAPTATGAQSLGAATTSTAAPAELFAMPVTLVISGTYSNIESFFNSLERLPRAMLVSAFSMSPSATAGTGANELSATLTASVFYAPGTSPPAVITPTTAPSVTTSPTATTVAPSTGTTPAGGTAPTPATSISRPPIPVEQG